MKTKKILEKTIEKHVRSYAEQRGFLSFKFTSPCHRSVPDRIFISPNGTVSFIEFKRKGGKLSVLQKYTIDKLLERKCDVHIIDDIDMGQKVINDILTSDKLNN